MRANKNMNDFTKDELKLLDFALSIINLWGSAYGDLRNTDGKKLRSKIQSIIDNFDHTPECNHYWVAEPLELKIEVNTILTPYPVDPIIKCKHCGIKKLMILRKKI